MAAMKAMASRAICSTLSGVVPVEPPTPALSNVTTRRSVASASISAGIPVVEVPAKVLEKDQRHTAGLRADVAVRVVDAVRGPDQLVRQAGVLADDGGHVNTFL
jgi:hypothetical protein